MAEWAMAKVKPEGTNRLPYALESMAEKMRVPSWRTSTPKPLEKHPRPQA